MFGRRGTGAPPEAPKTDTHTKPVQVEPPRIAPDPAPEPVVERAKTPPPVIPEPVKATPQPVREPQAPPSRSRSADYYDTKTAIFSALIDAIDLSQLARMDTESARDEIRDIVNEIISLKNVVMSISEQEDLLDDICNDVLGYGPLEPLLARDDIADIMVNGADTVYIEVQGRIERTGVRYKDLKTTQSSLEDIFVTLVRGKA